MQHKEYSEGTAQLIDDEVKGIIDEAYVETTKLLEEHLDALHAIANGLLKREVLDAQDIETLAAGGSLPDADPDDDGPGVPVEPEAEAASDADSQIGLPGQPAEGFTG